MTRILVVDDLESHLYLAKSLLEPFGYVVVVATNADEAKRALDASEPFDLILSDVGMPERNGFELIKQVKAQPRFEQVPFVFISSTVWSDTDKKQGLDLGAAKFIFRPMEGRAIITEIEEVLPPGKRLSKIRRGS